MSFLEGLLILVVDDEPDLREMLVSELQAFNTKTLEAKNGREAFDIVKKEKIDLVISDIRMPGGNGIEFLDATKKLSLYKPTFLFITAFSDITREELHAHGAESLIAKPFDLPSLLASLEWLCMPTKLRYSKKPEADVHSEINFIQNEQEDENCVFQMGRGGALLPTGHSIHETGSFIKFNITFPWSKKITGIGEVLWNGSLGDGEYCAGVEFRYFDDDTRDFAIETLSKCNSIAYVPERKEKIDN